MLVISIFSYFIEATESKNISIIQSVPEIVSRCLEWLSYHWIRWTTQTRVWRQNHYFWVAWCQTWWRRNAWSNHCAFCCHHHWTLHRRFACFSSLPSFSVRCPRSFCQTFARNKSWVLWWRYTRRPSTWNYTPSWSLFLSQVRWHNWRYCSHLWDWVKSSCTSCISWTDMNRCVRGRIFARFIVDVKLKSWVLFWDFNSWWSFRAAFLNLNLVLLSLYFILLSNWR